MISLCFMVALHDRYGIGKDRLDRVITAANGALERFAVNKRGVGMERAKKKLNEELEGLLTEHFVLPASKAPKSNRDWALLGERREAAEIVVKCYALGARQALGFGVERLNETVRATEDVFRQFNEWAEGGDWFGYNMLARRMTDILGERGCGRERRERADLRENVGLTPQARRFGAEPRTGGDGCGMAA